MAWIELHQSLWTHRKTLILAAELRMKAMYAATHMIHLWTWALDNAPEGDLSGLPDSVIAIGASWEEEPAKFVQAAVKAGYIDRDGETTSLHDWYDYAGKLIEQRAAERERSKIRRSLARQKKVDRQTTGGRPAVDRQTTVGTVPNLTVPNLDRSIAKTVPKLSTELSTNGRRKWGAMDPAELEESRQEFIAAKKRVGQKQGIRDPAGDQAPAVHEVGEGGG